MRSGKVHGSKLSDIVYGRPLSQIYFRAGAISSVVVASVLTYTVAYVITARPLFVWYTPTYLFVALSALTLLFTCVYMAVIAALEKRFYKRRFAMGRISSGYSRSSGFDFDVAVAREGKKKGYTNIQTFFVWVAILSLLVTVAALGVATGIDGESVIGFPKFVLSSIANPANITSKVFCISAIVCAGALFSLLMARIFVEEGINRVNIVMFSSHDAVVEARNSDRRLCDENSARSAMLNRSNLLRVLLDMAGAEKIEGDEDVHMYDNKEESLSEVLDQIVDPNGQSSVVLKHVVLSCVPGDAVRNKGAL